MKWGLFLLLMLIIGCTSDIDETKPEITLNQTTTIQEPTTTIKTQLTTTTTCIPQKRNPVTYSYDVLETVEIIKNETKQKVLSFDVLYYEKKVSYQGYSEYVFWKNDDFVEFANSLKIDGIYISKGILDYESIATNQTIELRNIDKEDGFFIVERLFPNFREGYYLDGSDNIKKVFIPGKSSVNVSFDKSIICYEIAKVDGSVNLMQYFIQHAEGARDQKDFIVNQEKDMIYACERAYFRIIPPEVEVVSTYVDDVNVVVNQQGSDTLVEFEKC